VRALGPLRSREYTQQAQTQATYIPPGAGSSSGSNKPVQTLGKPSEHDFEIAQQLLDSTSSSGSTNSTEEGEDVNTRRARRDAAKSRNLHGKRPRQRPAEVSVHSNNQAINGTLMGTAKNRATFVGTASTRQVGPVTEAKPVSAEGDQRNFIETGAYPHGGHPTDLVSRDGSDEYQSAQDFSHDGNILHDSLGRGDIQSLSTSRNERHISPVQRQPRLRRPRGFSFIDGDDILRVTPPASAATPGDPMNSRARPEINAAFSSSPQEDMQASNPFGAKSNSASSCNFTPKTRARVQGSMHSSSTSSRKGIVPTSSSTGSVVYRGRTDSTASSNSSDPVAAKQVSVTQSSRRHESPAHQIAAGWIKSDHSSPRSRSPSFASQRPSETVRYRSGGKARACVPPSSSTSSIPEQSLANSAGGSPLVLPGSVPPAGTGTPTRPGLVKKGSNHSATVSNGQSCTTPGSVTDSASMVTTCTAQIAAVRAIARRNQKGSEGQYPGSTTSGPGNA
jgi:hypothetical protein